MFEARDFFFERLADRDPVVLAFEDMQWADRSLLDFVEYLLDWSRNHPILVLAMARPELADRHPSWTGGLRNTTTLALEPLSDDAMGALLDGFVPGLPAELREQILGRAEGVPLYAVETVRMLLDRGLLEQSGDEYRPTGAIDSLEVPETLHALSGWDTVDPYQTKGPYDELDGEAKAFVDKLVNALKVDVDHTKDIIIK